MGTGQYAPAIESYTKALDLGNTNRGFISYSAALCAIRLGRRGEALEWLGRQAAAYDL